MEEVLGALPYVTDLSQTFLLGSVGAEKTLISWETGNAPVIPFKVPSDSIYLDQESGYF